MLLSLVQCLVLSCFNSTYWGGIGVKFAKNVPKGKDTNAVIEFLQCYVLDTHHNLRHDEKISLHGDADVANMHTKVCTTRLFLKKMYM